MTFCLEKSSPVAQEELLLYKMQFMDHESNCLLVPPYREHQASPALSDTIQGLSKGSEEIISPFAYTNIDRYADTISPVGKMRECHCAWVEVVQELDLEKVTGWEKLLLWVSMRSIQYYQGPRTSYRSFKFSEAHWS